MDMWFFFVNFSLNYCLIMKHRSSRFDTKNTKGRRLSNYSFKLILCSHFRSRLKGLCQNEKLGFDQSKKGRSLLRRTYGLKLSVDIFLSSYAQMFFIISRCVTTLTQVTSKKEDI